MSQKCVFDVSKKLKQDLPLSNSIGQDNKEAITPHDDRQLLRIMKKDRAKSSQMSSVERVLSNGKMISACIVYRRLISLGYKSYTAKRKPLRTPAQIKQRLTLAKDDIEWNNVIWSDEAHFEVLNGTFILRLKSESNELFSFIPDMQDGSGSVSVCGVHLGRCSWSAYDLWWNSQWCCIHRND